ncbi:hypothetical protein AB0L67_41770, partial [Streptomyces flaveolus]
MPMTDDDVLAEWIADHVFEERGGRPVLPPMTGPLGRRLQGSLVRADGTLHSGLGLQAQDALRAKGFTLVPVDGGRTGLASDTPRAGGYKPPPMTDDVLARWIADHEFESRGGRPVLPPAADSFAQRLHDALVRANGALNSGLGLQAQQALRAKGFTLASVDGGRTGLASDTLRAGEYKPPTTDDVLAQQITKYEFEERGGRPVLPHKTDPLGERLYRALVRSDGVLRSGLGSLAQQALRAKGFTLEAVAGGKRGPR